MTKVDHLHSECKIMPVRDHMEMLAKQFLLSTQLVQHPNQCPLPGPPPERLMRHTLRTRYGAEVAEYIPEGETVLQSTRYKSGLTDIHTRSVQQTLQHQGNNQVLGAPAPKISQGERELPRRTRTILVQLRSGYSSYLKSYLYRINARDTEFDSCPDCRQSAHTTENLFNCPSKPTHLTPRSLWDQPHDAAVFLGLETGRENTTET